MAEARLSGTRTAWRRWLAGLAAIAILVSATTGCGQAAGPTERWQVQLGTAAADTSFGVGAAPDGDVVVAGTTQAELGETHHGGRDIFLARFDPTGHENWRTQLGTPANDSPLGIDIAPDGSIYLTGFTEGDFAGDNLGSADVWIARFEPDGTEMWRRQFGADGWDRAFDVSAHSHGAYVSGYTASVLDPATDREGFDAFVASFDTQGNTDWIRQYGTDATDWGQGSEAIEGAGLYLTGYTEGPLAGDHLGDKDAFVMRIDADGEIVWTRQFGSAGLDWTQGVDVGPDGGVLVAGTSDGPGQGGRDLIVASFDADGDQSWVRQIGAAENDNGFEVRFAGGRIVVTGATGGDLAGGFGDRDAILVELDLDGTVIKIDQFGTAAIDDLTGLDIAPNGAILYSGYTSGPLGGDLVGDSDIFVGSQPPEDQG